MQGVSDLLKELCKGQEGQNITTGENKFALARCLLDGEVLQEKKDEARTGYEVYFTAMLHFAFADHHDLTERGARRAVL